MEASGGGCIVGGMLVTVVVGVGGTGCGWFCSGSVVGVCVVAGAVIVVAMVVATRMS